MRAKHQKSLAGLLLARSGATLCYAVDAISWLVMLAALAMMRPLSQVAGVRGAVSMRALREGVQFVRTHPVILSMMALDFGQNFFAAVEPFSRCMRETFLASDPSDSRCSTQRPPLEPSSCA